MSRTNIDIDDELLATVMKRHRLRTKREAVDYALRRLVNEWGEPATRDEILAMRGMGWGDRLELSDLRDTRLP